eukprot:176787_1
MKDWAIKAELIKSENDNDYIPGQFKIAYEPDCVYLSIQHAVLRNIEKQKQKFDDNDEKKDNNKSAHKKKRKKANTLSVHRPQININAKFKKGDKYILLDVGGGTCDVACHEVLGDFQIAEVLHPSGGPWGACCIDKEFEELLNQIFSKEWMNEFKKDYPQMYQQQLQNFITDSKTTFYNNIKQQYHSVTLVQNFLSFIMEKFED